jgi:CHAT domain-containing protein
LQDLIDAATEAFEALNSRPGKTISLILQAQVYQLRGQGDKAFSTLQKAEQLALELGIPELIIRSARLLGQQALQEGKMQAAEAYLQRAIAELEGVRASLTVDDFKAAYFGEKLDVYNDLIALYIQQERFEAAFHFVERSKSRALLDLLAKGVNVQKSSDPQVAALQKDLEAARAELNWHYLSAEREGPEGQHWEQVRASEQRVTRLIREIERLTPQAAALEQVLVPDLSAIQAQLKKDTILLEYFSVNDRLCAFLIDGEGLRCVQNLASLSDISEPLDRLQFTMMRVAQGEIFEQVYGGKDMLLKRTQAPLEALYQALIQPLELALSGQQLVIIPYGPLNAVPFSALYDGQRYLTEHVFLSLVPSAAVYLHCISEQRHASGDFMAFGVPFEDIPSVREEIEAVSTSFETARVLMGPEATLASFQHLAPEASILHIATHGLYRPDNPMFSGLRFFDGWLAARDLFSLKLNSPLVVLSACETGLSSQQASDELFGLARGFFYAGAPSMILSLWAVKDSPTAELMVHFYEALQAGLAVAPALQTAQTKLREGYPNPYFWAAFNVLGDPGRKIKAAPEQ